jgi:hypothetical protein
LTISWMQSADADPPPTYRPRLPKGRVGFEQSHAEIRNAVGPSIRWGHGVRHFALCNAATHSGPKRCRRGRDGESACSTWKQKPVERGMSLAV